jgi:hypothetical protein
MGETIWKKAQQTVKSLKGRQEGREVRGTVLFFCLFYSQYRIRLFICHKKKEWTEAQHHAIYRQIETTWILLEDATEERFVDRLGRPAKVVRLKPEQVLSHIKHPQRVTVRNFLCYRAVIELEIKGVNVAKNLKVSNSPVNRFVARGARIAADIKLKLIDLQKRTKTTPIFPLPVNCVGRT